MTAAEEIPETVVFDTEPFVAYFRDESGSDTVETYIDAVVGSSEGLHFGCRRRRSPLYRTRHRRKRAHRRSHRGR